MLDVGDGSGTASSARIAARSGVGMAGLDSLSSPPPLADALQPCPEYPHVRIVRDYATLRAVGRIRHAQYVETQGKGYASAVLDLDCLIELPDFSGVNIYAFDEKGITAGMRIGLMTDPSHPAACAFAEVAADRRINPRLTLTCTRLVRSLQHRGRHATDLMMFTRYRTVVSGYRYCIIQAGERMIRYFEQFECVQTGLWMDDGAAGRLQFMVLDTRMFPHLHGSENLAAA